MSQAQEVQASERVGNDNPLQPHVGEMPRFADVRPEMVESTVREMVNSHLEIIDRLVEHAKPPYWETVIQPLHNLEDRLDQAWAMVSHLNAVCQDAALRQAHDACLPLLSEYRTRLGQHKGLMAVYQHIGSSGELSTLTLAQQKAVENALRDFHLSGVDLEPKSQQQYGEISARLSSLSSQFANQLLDATRAWSKVIEDPALLSGLPQTALQLLRAQAEARQSSGWLMTLDAPSYLAVMTHADNRSLRKEVYEAYVTRASDVGPHAGKYDNTPIMVEILELRQALASLLGFSSYAAYSLATKMADSPEKVEHFLRDLAARARPAAERDLAELLAFARTEYGLASVEAWDVPWLSEKMRQRKYSLDQEALRGYFPVPVVLEGLFQVIRRLFGVDVVAEPDRMLWHADACRYRLEKENKTIAFFYLDLYARENKRGGAWMGECRVRRILDDGRLQLPEAFLTCNFMPPVADRPSLLTFDELTTLFHEFGHGLHHMLTAVDCMPVSGINGVAWDAVELPSQLLENWCWQEEVIALVSSHHETGERLPGSLLQKMLEARHFQAGLQMLRQIEFALFDFILHKSSRPPLIQPTLDAVRQEVAVLHPPTFNRFQNSFSHIFAGGYAAGYYSYKWAEVLSADVFSIFEQHGLFDRATSQRFLAQILSRGGEADALVLFRDFVGRDPEPSALLRQHGLISGEVCRS